MVLCFRAKALVSVIALVGTLYGAAVQADSTQKSWAERLGLISYEPLEQFYKDYESLAYSNLHDGPLVPFLPNSAHDIYAIKSRFLDQVIADYKFDKSDWAFFSDEWEELVDQADTDHVLSVFKTCPWKRPLPAKGRYFRSIKQEMWGIRGYVIVEEDNYQAWYYWSVPEPARGSFCE